MAKQTDRVTTGKSYSGKHRGLRRNYTDTLEAFTAMDAVAAREGIPWAEWARAILANAVRKARA